nr:hypothetical protein [uncultured Cohaesibacter sp.]
MSQKYALIAALIASLALAGCVTTQQPTGSLSPTEMAMRQKQNENVRILQGVATGAAVGAIVGGGLGLLLGGDEKSMAQGAMIGALGGGVFGAADAQRVNKEAGAQAAQQDQLKGVIANAEKNIAHYQEMANFARQLAAEEKAEIDRLNAQLSAGQLAPDAYRAQMSSARGNVKIVNSQISNVDRDISDLEGATKKGMNVKKQIAELKAQKVSLETQRDALVSAYSRVPSEVGVTI